MASQNRKSLLTYEPVNFSLTDGTNIPPPAQERAQVEEPPVTNGHHSALQTPAHTNGEVGAHKSSADEAGNGRADSVRTSPASINNQVSPRQKSVRRLFSLSSLRSSFGSSRTSLAIPQEHQNGHAQEGVKRPLSPDASMSSTVAPTQTRPQARPSKSGGGSWFRRKSNLSVATEKDALASIGEDGRPTTRESKRLRDRSPPPLLPEINTLAGGNLNDGGVGWDERLFKR